MQNLAIITIAFFTIAAAIITTLSEQKPGLTISQRIALRKSTTIVFGSVVILSTVEIGVFFIGWLGPHFELGPLYYILVGILLLLFVTIGVFPHTPEESMPARIHNTAAWWASYVGLAIIASILIESFGSINMLTRVLTISFLVYGISFRFIFYNARLARFRLFSESLWLVWFMVVVLCLTYFN